MEHLAKRVIIQTSLGKKVGREQMENSVRSIIPALQATITDMPINYLPLSVVNDYAKIADDLKESNAYVIENLNFRPEEHSYVEPWVEPEDPNEEPEAPHFEVLAPEVLKKMPPADKKKYEEELKKHEEQELLKS
jgi:3-phosphoglycerate kinase